MGGTFCSDSISGHGVNATWQAWPAWLATPFLNLIILSETDPTEGQFADDAEPVLRSVCEAFIETVTCQAVNGEDRVGENFNPS